VATVEDAIEVLTDRANLASFGETGSAWRAVNDSLVLRELRRRGESEAAARNLCLEALERLGGRIEQQTRTGGLQAGRQRQHRLEVWYIPRNAVRG
jgi:hypothetical protein